MSDHAEGPGWWQASDGKWYPPQPSQAPPPPPPPSPTPPPPQTAYQPGPPVAAAPAKQGAGCLKIGLIVLGVLAIIGIGLTVLLVVAVDDAVDDHDDRQGEIADDVELSSCGLSDAGFMEAELRVTNNSSERSNYGIEVAFEAPNGDQIDTGFASVSALDAGQSTTVTAVTLTEPTGDGQFECDVVDVTRFSDE